MAHEVETRACTVLAAICGGPFTTPVWLRRPRKANCGSRWELVRSIYRTLTTKELPDEVPLRETRRVDGMFRYEGRAFVFELDEIQHFNSYRAGTLAAYPNDLSLAFDKHEWIRRSQLKKKLEGGGWAKPRPPLFPDVNGRHQQRAFRDALADILPTCHEYLPTLRVGDFEVRDWIANEDAQDRMAQLLHERFAGQSS